MAIKKIIILLFCFMGFTLLSYAEIIVLKNGKTIIGKITERTNRYVKINILDMPLTYYFDDIESIDGQRIIKLPKEQNQTTEKEISQANEKINFLPSGAKTNLSLEELKAAQEYAKKGLSFFEEKNYKEAIIEYEKALQINPNFAEGYHGLGYSYALIGKYPEAIACFNKAIAIVPDYADALNGLGYVYSILGDYTQSIEYYQKALKVRKDNLETYNGLGYSYASLGKYKEAVEYFKEAIKLNSEYAPAYSGLGVVYYSLGQNSEAKENFLKAKEILVKNKEEDRAKDIDEYIKKLP